MSETPTELPFAVRRKMLRKSRRRRALHVLRQETVWVIVLSGAAILVVAQLLGAVGRV